MESFDELTKAEYPGRADQIPVHAGVDGLALQIVDGIVDSNTTKETNTTKDDAPILPSISSSPANDRTQTASPVFPQLTNDQKDSLRRPAQEEHESDDEDKNIDGLKLSRPTLRLASPSPEISHSALIHNVSDEGVIRMHRFTLYETQSLYYIIGSDMLRQSYRILKISRMSDAGELDLVEDDIIYTHKETQQIVNAIDEGNRSTGGLKVKINEFWGLLGFVKFTGAFYMSIVSRRSHVAVFGGHYIDKIDKTEMIQLTTSVLAKAKTEKYLEEARLLGIFSAVDLSKGFYFSRSYDITRTLQHNIIRERQAINEGLSIPSDPDHNDMFIWNHHLLEPARKHLQKPFDWCLAIIHGYIDQSALSIYWGRVVYITIIARRSRFFAGARYLKRGANDLGYVANDVETEQIVSEMQTQSFHGPGRKLFANPNYTSYVQHRGSIPLYWTQDASGVQPKPDIHLSIFDPFYSAAALHFDNLFHRYGTPIFALNLVKQKEKFARESKLGSEYKTAVQYLNQFLPEDKKIIYKAFDQARATKSKDGDVIGDLEEIAENVLAHTGFFHNGSATNEGAQLQNGVARTNCIDCIDRTNAAQFMIGKKALGYQLQALGVLEDTTVEFDTDATVIFTNMYHDHGDTIAIQYGGSHLVNTMSTYRKMNGWQSHSRDMVENLKRFYNNSFLDAQRQEAYNLFLGIYIYKNGSPMLWDMSSDYYLHHTEPRSMYGRSRPGYRDWYTPSHLKQEPRLPDTEARELRSQPLSYFDDYWAEYYRPLTLSSFRKIFAFKMHSNLTVVNIPEETQDGRYDLSPFVVRGSGHPTPKEKQVPTRKKGVKIVSPAEEHRPVMETSIEARLAQMPEEKKLKLRPQDLDRWLDMQHMQHALRRKYTGIIKDSAWEKASRTPIVPAMPGPNTLAMDMKSQPSKAEREAMVFEKLVSEGMNPVVRESEEYRAYLEHPANIALVTSTDVEYSNVPKDFIEYIARNDEELTLRYQHAINPLLEDYADAPYPFLTVDERAERNTEVYEEYVDSGLRSDPLSVLQEDDTSKRYKKYRSWLKGKSLFKQKNFLEGEVV